MFQIRSSIVLLSLVLIIGQVFAKGESPRYPNELKGLQFYETSKWKSFTPLVSTMADVRTVLGAPKDTRDVDQYTKPYPGDAKAKLPVFTYEMDADWEILVYFVKYSSCECPKLKKINGDLLYSVELVPKNRIPFATLSFPAAFKKKSVVAVDAAWDEYADGSG